MSDLVNVTRAELAKLVRRPAAWVLLAAAITLSQVFGFVIPYLSFRNGSTGAMTDGETGAQLLAGTLPAQVVTNTTAAFPVFAGALALVLGALVTGNEFTGGTMKTLLTQGPRRAAVFGGQLLALVVAVGVGVLALFLTCAASAWGIALVEDQAVVWPSVGDLAAGLGSGWVVMAMWAALGGRLRGGAALRRPAHRPRRRVDPRHREPHLGRGAHLAHGVAAVAGRAARGQLGVADQLGAPGPGRPAAPGVQSTVSGGQGLVTVAAYAVVAALAVVLVGRRRDVAA